MRRLGGRVAVRKAHHSSRETQDGRCRLEWPSASTQLVRVGCGSKAPREMLSRTWVVNALSILAAWALSLGEVLIKKDYLVLWSPLVALLIARQASRAHGRPVSGALSCVISAAGLLLALVVIFFWALSVTDFREL